MISFGLRHVFHATGSRMTRWLKILALSAMAACIPDDLDLEGRPCPCVDDTYLCVDMVCVLAADFDAGTDASLPDAAGDSIGAADSATDASPGDAGPDDAGPGDTGPGDAGPGDARPGDVGPGDVGNDAPDAPEGTFCERHGTEAIRCLDFETNPTTLGWTASTRGDSTINMDATFSVSGNSLRVSSGLGDFANYEQVVPAVNSGTLWYRARFFVENPIAQRFWSLMAVGGVGATGQYTHTALNSGQRVFVSHRNDGTESAGTSTSSYATDSWFCLEASVDVRVGGEVNLYLDGELVLTRTVDGSGPWSRLNVGSVGTNSTQAISDVWIDDYVFSTTRVPCELE